MTERREPRWLELARADIGVRETPGKETTPTIRRWLIELNAWWRDDETPWCGVALAYWMKAAGQEIPKHYYRARAWLDWGTTLCKPIVGCVVIFERGAGGHVGLVVGRSPTDRLLVLGGNQSDSVSIAAFSRARVLGYRWPTFFAGSSELPTFRELPLSTNEA